MWVGGFGGFGRGPDGSQGLVKQNCHGKVSSQPVPLKNVWDPCKWFTLDVAPSQ